MKWHPLEDADLYQPRITPPRSDRMGYRQIIRGNPIGTNGNLTVAWRIIDAFVSAMSSTKAERYLSFLLERLEVVCLWVPSSIDANAVYEAINYRGKQLDDLDLIRNFLYSHFRGDSERVRRETVHDNLEALRDQITNDRKAAEYMRCYLQCRFGFLRRESFYRETREAIRVRVRREEGEMPDAGFVYHLVGDLTSMERVELFRTMTAAHPNPELIAQFCKHSKTTNDQRHLGTYLRELRGYKVSQPLIFAMLVRYLREPSISGKRRIARLVAKNLRSLTAFVSRTAFVAPKFEPSHFEAAFSNCARTISDAEDLGSVDFADFLSDCDRSGHGILDDSRFRTAIEIGMMKGNPKIKQFLLGVTSAVQSDAGLLSARYCTVEHVLPRSKDHWGRWRGFDGVNCADWVHRVGNLALLGQADNKPGSAFNSSFAKKRGTYLDSAVEITRRVGEYEEWSPDGIRKRQKELASLAVRVWKA